MEYDQVLYLSHLQEKQSISKHAEKVKLPASFQLNAMEKERWNKTLLLSLWRWDALMKARNDKQHLVTLPKQKGVFVKWITTSQQT